MARSVEEIINQAARQLGLRRRLGSVYDGSELAKAALEVYGQTRDELLRRQSWGFAGRQHALTLAVNPPAAGWLFAYSWPPDAILIRAVLPYPVMMPDLNPVDYLFQVFNDGADPSSRVIFSNVASPIAFVTARVTDPAQWDAGFAAAMIAGLADKLEVALASGDANMAAMAAGKAGRAMATGIMVNELQPPIDIPPAAPLPAARGQV